MRTVKPRDKIVDHSNVVGSSPVDAAADWQIIHVFIKIALDVTTFKYGFANHRKASEKGCSSQHVTLGVLTHWGRVTHISVGELTIIGSYSGLSPGRRQAIIWTNVEIKLIGPTGKNFYDILIGIQTFSIKEIHLKMSSAKWRPYCLGLNVLISYPAITVHISGILNSSAAETRIFLSNEVNSQVDNDLTL